MIIKAKKSPVRFFSFLITILFFAFSLLKSHIFYQLNSFKLMTLLLFLTTFIPIFYYKPYKVQFDNINLNSLLFILSPYLLTFFGLLLQSQGQYNYNFTYELSAFCILGCWFMMVKETFIEQKNLDIFFKMLCILLIIVAIHASIQGYNLNWKPNHIKSTFGNRNYFAGLLIQLFPLFFAFGFFKRKISYQTPQWIFQLSALFCLFSIFLIRSRAGIGATIIASTFITFFYFFLNAKQESRKKIIYIFISCTFLPLTIYLLAFLLIKNTQDYALFNILTFEGWYDRINTYQAAWASIKKSPIIGWGLGSSYSLYFKFVPPHSQLIIKDRSFNHAHSEFFEIFQEGGILSFFMYLFFWFFIFFKGIQLLKKESPSSEKFFLILGLLGAFLAYNIQSLVSVAPRMIVTRLPLFFNFAIFFSLFTFDPFKSRNIFYKKLAYSTPLILILIALITYLPWAIKQYNHFLVTKEHIRPHKTAFYKKTLLYDDVYNASHLTRVFMFLNMLPEVKQAVDKTKSLIPHYRDIDYVEGLFYLRTNNLPKAKESLLTMQKYNRFHTYSNLLLCKIAIKQNDLALWLEQFKILNRILLKTSGLLIKSNAIFGEVKYLNTGKIIEIQKTQKAFKISYIKSYIIDLFNKIRKAQNRPFKKEKSSKNIYHYIIQRFYRLPFFQIKFKKGISFQEQENTKRLIQQIIQLRSQMAGAKNKEVIKTMIQSKEKYINSTVDDWPLLSKKFRFARSLASTLSLKLSKTN